MGERKGRVELAKVDVDKLQELAMQYDVSNCPPSPPPSLPLVRVAVQWLGSIVFD